MKESKPNYSNLLQPIFLDVAENVASEQHYENAVHTQAVWVTK